MPTQWPDKYQWLRIVHRALPFSELCLFLRVTYAQWPNGYKSVSRSAKGKVMESASAYVSWGWWSRAVSCGRYTLLLPLRDVRSPWRPRESQCMIAEWFQQLQSTKSFSEVHRLRCFGNNFTAEHRAHKKMGGGDTHSGPAARKFGPERNLLTGQVGYYCHLLIRNICIVPWLVWLSGLSVSLQSKGSLVWFPVRAHAWVAGQVPSRGHTRGNHTLMFLSLLSPQKINK